MTEFAHRWRVKNAARKAVVLSSVASWSVAIQQLDGKPSARALTCYRFGHVERNPWWIFPRVFDDQMRWLAEHSLAVSLDDHLRFSGGEINLPTGSVVVAIDDGFGSVATVAAPVLYRYAIPAVVFVTTSQWRG